MNIHVTRSTQSGKYGATISYKNITTYVPHTHDTPREAWRAINLTVQYVREWAHG